MVDLYWVVRVVCCVSVRSNRWWRCGCGVCWMIWVCCCGLSFSWKMNVGRGKGDDVGD